MEQEVEVIPVIIGATKIVDKNIKKYVNNVCHSHMTTLESLG